MKAERRSHMRKRNLNLSLVLLVWMVLGGQAYGQEAQTPPPMDLETGWQYRWGDSPLADSGVPVWSAGDISTPGWRSLSFTSLPTDREDQTIIWMRLRLPEERWPDPTLFLREVLVAGEAYLDGRRIYRTGAFEPTSENTYRTSAWHLVPLPADCGGKVLTLRMYSNHDQVIGIVYPPRLGRQADVIQSILMERLDSLVFGVLLIFLGPASLLLYVKRRDREFVGYLSFGAFATCIGVNQAVYVSGPGLLLYAPTWIYYLGHLSFYLFPIGLFAFLEQIVDPGPQRVMRRLWQFHVAFALAGLVLDLLDVIPLPLLQPYLLAVLAVGVLVSLWVAGRSALQGNVEARIVSVGAGILVLAGFYDILMAYGLLPDGHELFQWGTFAFVISLGYALERRFVENHRRLAERTVALSETNADLWDEIIERKRAEEALQKAHAEVNRLKDRLESENVYLQEEIKLEHNFDEIITQSEPFKAVLRQIEQVASTDSAVLILGETGTGKELVARAVHNISNRRERPLVKVNCAVLPANLIESELFGHEKGAFTGALSRKIGRFELADGGTIFLDEIGDLPLELQAKLLRVLQEGEFDRLGSTRTTTVDVRAIAATNRDLEAAIAGRQFREDLYYRLNVFPIHVPPLREHRDDIPILVNHFVKKYGPRAGKTIETVPQRTIDDLQAYDWPGNVRELENTVERAVVLSRGKKLELGEWLPGSKSQGGSEPIPTLEELERRHIAEILERTGWRVRGERGAAELLGLKPTTLESRMDRLGIKRKP